ncbi:MAG TPA: prolyl oligopeptidase family serine peptidase, partial [Ignavibacteriaceae bacterium]|nr:prolyl oligopeptidase family serine peptidase [Ignavibacteriaceae bacterium]
MSALKINKLILILIGIMFLNNQGLSQDIKPPVAKKIPKELKIHNQIRTDNYYWLNQREDPEVISYLNAENEYTEKVLKKTEPLQEKLYNEMISRIKQNDESVPYKRNGYFYYTRFEEGKDYPIYCRKKDNLNSSEEIMLNVNEMAKDYAYYNVSGLTVSPDNKLLAFGVDNVSRRIYTIYVKNLETGKILSDSIKSTSSNSVFAADNKTLFYSVIDSTLRSDKIYRHILGDNQEKDKLVYDEPDATFNVFVYKTRSKDYIVIGSSSTLTNDFRILKANDPLGEFKEFSPRKKGVEYQVDHFNNKFYIVTNYEAQNFRLMTSDANKTSIENWKELIPHRKDVLLEGIELFDKFLVIQERKNGLTNIRIKSWDGEFEHNLDFGEPAYLAYIEMNPEPNTEILRYGYTSLTTPNSVIDYNMVTREKTIMKEDEILGGFNKANYTSERIYVKAEDGTMIPVSMVYRKDLDTTKTNPLLLYGYGSYGISTDPTFSSVRLSLLDRGFIYAIAHIRGGQELGRGWYDDGKLLKKMNTFTDFIDCAKFLIENK